MSDTTLIKHLIPDWMERLLEDCEDEETSKHVLLLGCVGRRVLWSISKALKNEREVTPLACRLFERYLAARFRDGPASQLTGTLPEDVWREYKRSLGAQMPLLMVSCVQLAGKMATVHHKLNAKMVKHQLDLHNLPYSLEEIISSEYHVYQTLEFRIPLWTSGEAAVLLAVEVDLPSHLREPLALMISYAEFRRNDVQQRVRWAAGFTSPGKSSGPAPAGSLRTLHLAAGAVVAAAHLADTAAAVCARLAQLTRAPPPLLHAISLTLREMLMIASDDEDIDL